MNISFIDELQSVVDTGWTHIKENKFWGVANQAIENNDPTLFFNLMCQIYHYTKHNAINQAVATFNTDNTKIGLLRFAFTHANEELGHENLVVRDLKSIGMISSEDDMDKYPALPATTALVGYLYYVALNEDLTARLGYSFWAENSYHYFNDVLLGVKEKFGLSKNNMTFFDAHSVIDESHSKEVNEQIQKWITTDIERKKCLEVAETSLYLTGCILDQVADKYIRRKN